MMHTCKASGDVSNASSCLIQTSVGCRSIQEAAQRALLLTESCIAVQAGKAAEAAKSMTQVAGQLEMSCGSTFLLAPFRVGKSARIMFRSCSNENCENFTIAAALAVTSCTLAGVKAAHFVPALCAFRTTCELQMASQLAGQVALSGFLLEAGCTQAENQGLGFRGCINGFYWDHGKENGNYYIIKGYIGH